MLLHSIPKSEVALRQIKALSGQNAIGIDRNDNLWEYVEGTWTLIGKNVKNATINYNGDVFWTDPTTGFIKFKLLSLSDDFFFMLISIT